MSPSAVLNTDDLQALAEELGEVVGYYSRHAGRQLALQFQRESDAVHDWVNVLAKDIEGREWFLVRVALERPKPIEDALSLKVGLRTAGAAG